MPDHSVPKQYGSLRFIGCCAQTAALDQFSVFKDPDGDELTFSTGRLPVAISLSSNGVLSGQSNNRNRGAWFIVIEAYDGFGESASDGFLLVIN